ncbi:type 4a pilus biogenesis protein PilO [Candidatus Kuenenbacteria bacterium]|nr:type 4a pilus biogenesis protein PilO [Candidatus Kuenenbacteria bacterium]
MKKNNLLLLVLLPCMTLVLIFLAIWPAARSLSQNKQIIAQNRQAMADLLARGQNIDKNQKNLNLIEGNLGLLDEAYLKRGEELNFITDLERAATNNNIEQTINFNNELGQEQGGVRAIPFELRISGDMLEIMAYINTLERLPYYINIGRIELASGNTRETKQTSTQVYQEEGESETAIKNIISANLTGVTYWK